MAEQGKAMVRLRDLRVTFKAPGKTIRYAVVKTRP